jgi:hypothetical protein
VKRSANILDRWVLLVPAAGLEPARSCELRILSPLRLPFRQAGIWCAVPDLNREPPT